METAVLQEQMYGTRRAVESRLGKIERAEDLPSEVKEALAAFDAKIAADGLSQHRRLFYMTWLPKMARILGPAFQNPSRKDVEGAMRNVESDDYKEWTKVNIRTALKRFYKWRLGNDEEYPECVRWLKARRRTAMRSRLPKDLLTRVEIGKLLEACENARDRALISLLADTGCRIGELLTLTLGRVERNRQSLVLIVTGKTGDRRVLAVGDSIVYVSTWLSLHPQRKDRDAPLFVGLEGKAAKRGMTYAAARKAILSAARRAGLGKRRVHAHLFRHTVATELASKMTEATLEGYLGWVPGSAMASTYVRLSGRDVDAALLRAKGIEVPPEAQDKPAMPRTCPRCTGLNESGARFCRLCGLALDVETAMKADRAAKREEEMMDAVLQEPAVRREVLNALRKMRKSQTTKGA
jgi:integrase